MFQLICSTISIHEVIIFTNVINVTYKLTNVWEIQQNLREVDATNHNKVGDQHPFETKSTHRCQHVQTY